MNQTHREIERESKEKNRSVKNGQDKARPGFETLQAFPDFPGEGWMGGFNCTRRENAKQMPSGAELNRHEE